MAVIEGMRTHPADLAKENVILIGGPLQSPTSFTRRTTLA
jgi:hypothetical protein